MDEVSYKVAWEALYKMVTVDHQRVDIETLIYEYADQIHAIYVAQGYGQPDEEAELPFCKRFRVVHLKEGMNLDDTQWECDPGLMKERCPLLKADYHKDKEEQQ